MHGLRSLHGASWNVDKNAEAKTMVINAEFKTSITNVWQLWADPPSNDPPHTSIDQGLPPNAGWMARLGD